MRIILLLDLEQFRIIGPIQDLLPIGLLEIALVHVRSTTRRDLLQQRHESIRHQISKRKILFVIRLVVVGREERVEGSLPSDRVDGSVLCFFGVGGDVDALGAKGRTETDGFADCLDNRGVVVLEDGLGDDASAELAVGDVLHVRDVVCLVALQEVRVILYREVYVQEVISTLFDGG